MSLEFVLWLRYLAMTKVPNHVFAPVSDTTETHYMKFMANSLQQPATFTLDSQCLCLHMCLCVLVVLCFCAYDHVSE